MGQPYWDSQKLIDRQRKGKEMNQTTIDLIIFLAWGTISLYIIGRKPKSNGRHAKK